MGSLRERDIERRLVSEARERGGLAVKLVSPGMDGLPDRLVLMPDGKVAFVELKAPGKKLRPVQRVRIRQLVALGFGVFVVDSTEQIKEVLDAVQTT